VDFDPFRPHATALSADFKAYPMHLKVTSADPRKLAEAIDSMATYGTLGVRECVFLSGMPGTGKTFFLRNWIRQEVAAGRITADNFKIHTWNQTLRAQAFADFSAEIPGRTSSNFPSGNRPLMEGAHGTMVFDDAGLLYNGMIPLIVACNPSLTRLVFTFDPAQAATAFPEQDCMCDSVPRTAAFLSQFCDNYATIQQRLSRENCELFGLPAAGHNGHGFVYTTSAAPPDVPFLAASPRYVNTKRGGVSDSISFGASQVCPSMVTTPSTWAVSRPG